MQHKESCSLLRRLPVTGSVLSSLLAAFALAFAYAGPSYGGSVALQFGSSGPPNNANYFGPGFSDVIAYEFTPTHDIAVTSLGFYDIVSSLQGVPGSANGLSVAHQVAIYRVSDQTLITSGVVQAGTASPKIDSFRYTSIAPVTLFAGVEYVIGATTGAHVNGVFGQDATVNANVGSDILANPLISIGDRRSTTLGDGFSLAYPNFKFNLNFPTRGFGPNFTFTTVPEPTSLTLEGLGGLLVCAYAISRRRS